VPESPCCRRGCSSTTSAAKGRLARPFAAEVALGAYWLTWLKSRTEAPAMRAFRTWSLARSEAAAHSP
jgi:LysR family transcriptional regulator of beta-lactamase